LGDKKGFFLLIIHNYRLFGSHWEKEMNDFGISRLKRIAKETKTPYLCTAFFKKNIVPTKIYLE
jgi:hypothetical protein